MPSTRRKPSSSVIRFTLGLASKLGSGLFISGVIGLVSQYFQNNPTGMLVFCIIGYVGLVVTMFGLVGDELQ